MHEINGNDGTLGLETSLLNNDIEVQTLLLNNDRSTNHFHRHIWAQTHPSIPDSDVY